MENEKLGGIQEPVVSRERVASELLNSDY